MTPPALPNLHSSGSNLEGVHSILVVDDEQESAQAMGRTLSENGYRIRSVAKWTEALTAIQDRPPDLVLLDLDLPTVRGDALLDFIKENVEGLPVIIVSPEVDSERMTDLSERGANGFLKKPFEPDDLLVVVEQVLAVWSMPAPTPPDGTASPGPEDTEDTKDTAAGEGTSSPSPPAREDSSVQPGAGAARTTPPPVAPRTPKGRRTSRRRGRRRRTRRLRNAAIVFLTCLVIAWVYWLVHETLDAGFFGIGI